MWFPLWFPLRFHYCFHYGSHHARQAIWSLPLCSALIVALCFELRGRVRWALPFHLLALGVCVLALDTIAVYGPSLNLIGWAGELSHARQEGYSLAANGLFFLGCTLLFARCGSLDLRRGALMLEVLVPIHLLGALYETALQERELVDLWVYVGVVLAVLMLGAMGNHRRLLYGGLLGLAFGGHLPLALDLVEAIPYALWLGAGGLLVALGTRGWIGR